MPVRHIAVRMVPLVLALGLAACGGAGSGDGPAQAGDAPPPAAAGAPMSLEQQVAAAKADLAGRLGVPADDIEVVEAREVTWPDASLGCPEPGMMYAQVLTPGVLVRLVHAGREHGYHARQGRSPVECPGAVATDPVETGLGRPDL